MVNPVTDFLIELDFKDLLQVLFDNSFYDIVFPFLISFVLFYSVLPKIKLFQHKDGRPISSIVFIISFIIAWFGISFELGPSGHTVGTLMMMMFPNISALTIGILGLYVVGSILGKNFFKGLFDKKTSAFAYLVAGGIGLSSIIYYVGIAMGFWDLNPNNQEQFWSFILALFFLILGITFLFIDLVPVGILFLLIFGAFVYNNAEDHILSYFVDPVVFIVVIFVIFVSWINSDKDKKFIIAKDLNKQEKFMQDYIEDHGKRPKDYESSIHDIVDSNYDSNKKKWEKHFPGENWRDFK